MRNLLVILITFIFVGSFFAGCGEKTPQTFHVYIAEGVNWDQIELAFAETGNIAVRVDSIDSPLDIIIKQWKEERFIIFCLLQMPTSENRQALRGDREYILRNVVAFAQLGADSRALYKNIKTFQETTRRFLNKK